MQKIKCFFVGDEGVGKTSLFDAYTKRCCSPEFQNFDNYDIYNMYYKDIPISIEFWDANKKVFIDSLISNQFPQIDVFLLCFSVVSEQSLENIEKIWEPKIRQYSSNPSLILIGCKNDLRTKYLENDTGVKKEEQKPIPISKCIEIKDIIKAQDCIECSAYYRTNLENLLNSICQTFLQKI